jgi:hypothetical protein
VEQQLADHIDRVNWWCKGEATVLQYALDKLPTAQYSVEPSNTLFNTYFGSFCSFIVWLCDQFKILVLYRGGGRDTTFFCNQFVDEW